MNHVENKSDKRDKILALLAIAIITVVALVLMTTGGNEDVSKPQTVAEQPAPEVIKETPPPTSTEIVAVKNDEKTAEPVAEIVVEETPKKEDAKKIETPKKEESKKTEAKKTETPKKEDAKKVETPKKENKVFFSEQVDEKDVVIIADESAQPKHGYENYYKYIKGNLKYPEEAKKQGAEGKVHVEFVVKIDGKLANVRIKRGIGFGCDEEAVRVIQEGDQWKPALDKGKAVMQKVTIPISFKLN